ncbi:Uncharacterised protein [Mycobacteroides abscessus subsp. abscessus]|nr:Uncharacterised protein [Mycobacteroides abscessus subsp. abscessus]
MSRTRLAYMPSARNASSDSPADCSAARMLSALSGVAKSDVRSRCRKAIPGCSVPMHRKPAAIAACTGCAGLSSATACSPPTVTSQQPVTVLDSPGHQVRLPKNRATASAASRSSSSAGEGSTMTTVSASPIPDSFVPVTIRAEEPKFGALSRRASTRAPASPVPSMKA